MDIRSLIRDVPDFPKPGILFKDITPVLQNPEAFKYVVDQFLRHYRDQDIDVIVGVDARGFLFASVLAYHLGKSLAIVRKKGKLPYITISYTYQLEYGEDTVELHEDAIPKKSRVLIVDDLLATGGTAVAAAHLIEKMGAEVAGLAFLIELKFLQGREKLKGHSVFSQIQYE